MPANWALKFASPRGADAEVTDGMIPPSVLGEEPAILESRLLNHVS